MDDMPVQLQQLIDKQEIGDVLARYSRAVDRADIDLLRACYHDDATEDHAGVFVGPASDYVDMLVPILPRAGIMSHALSNILIDLQGDMAVSECYLTTFARMKKDGEIFDTLTMARAVDRFEKRDGKWAIAKRTLSFEWNMELPKNENWARGMIVPDPSVLVRGGKKPNDIIYHMLNEAQV